MKPKRNAIAYIIYNSEDESKFIVVQRPFEEENHPGMWGLPAGSVKEGENFEEAVLRSGKEKLGVELKIVKALNEGDQEREKYHLTLRNYIVKIVEGEPTVPQPIKGITQYRDWKWGDYTDIIETARKESLCCRLYLEYIGKKW